MVKTPLPALGLSTLSFDLSMRSSNLRLNLLLRIAVTPPRLVFTSLTSERDTNAPRGAYAYIERSYEDDNDLEKSGKSSEVDTLASSDRSPSPPPDSKLDKSVQELVRLIFDVSIM